jgi:hypothetical protein
VLLEYRGRRGAAPLVRVQREALLDRFARGFAGARKPAWAATLAAFEREGAGVALWLGPDDAALPDAGTLDLLCAAADDGRARALAEGDEPALDAALADALARAGAPLALPLRLRADAA